MPQPVLVAGGPHPGRQAARFPVHPVGTGVGRQGDQGRSGAPESPGPGSARSSWATWCKRGSARTQPGWALPPAASRRVYRR